MNFLRNIKYRLQWLKLLNSCFKLPKIFIYFGEIKYGTPYFLPRKWCKKTNKYKPKKWGLDLVPLGWKVKFNQYRHEWNPAISIVLFKKQLFISFGRHDFLEDVCYWETLLYYKYDTNKSSNKEERLKKVFKNNKLIWKDSNNNKTNYYYKILRKKYIKLYEQYIKLNKKSSKP